MQEHTLEGHEGAVTSVAVSPDNAKVLATARSWLDRFRSSAITRVVALLPFSPQCHVSVCGMIVLEDLGFGWN